MPTSQITFTANTLIRSADVNSNFTGIYSGTSGGIIYYASATSIASSGALTANQLIIGGGAGAAPSSLAAGSQYQVLVMGAANPGYGQVNLAQSAAVTGALSAANGGTGVANNAAATLTRSGNHDLTLTTTGTTSLTLPTSGTVSVLTTATQAEQETGTSTTAAVTPGRQQYHLSAAKAWAKVLMNGTTSGAYNINSVSDGGAGDFTISWETDFSNTSYIAVATPSYDTSVTTATTLVASQHSSSQAAGSARFLLQRLSDAALTDAITCGVVAFGDQ